MRRFLFNPNEVADSAVRLCSEESHHITNVLRLSAGTQVELFDGQGNLFLGEIEELGKNVRIRLVSRQETIPQEGAALWLFQADLKGKKMDLVIQKSTELGVERIFPFTCSRSQGRVGESRRKRKSERWQKLIEGACKQSMRLTLMRCEKEVSMTAALGAAILSQSSGPKLLFWEEEKNFTLSDVDWSQPFDRASIMLGPEGGFSEQEIAAAHDLGWQSVSLGRQVLRAETATIAAISIVQHHLGKM
jgi:16S rRNA (uracil1498-N3)-methyltransferase